MRGITNPTYRLRQTPVINSGTYQARDGEIVSADANTNAITVTAPANPLNDQEFVVDVLDGTNFVTVQAGDATGIETAFTSVVDSQALLYGSDTAVLWKYNAAADVWRIVWSNAGEYLEAWQATPVNDIGASQTIIWSHAPLYAGQVPLLMSHSSGTFSVESKSATHSVDLLLNIEYDANSNNSEAKYLAELLPGLGDVSSVFRVADILDSFQSSRGGDQFPRSHRTNGVMQVLQGDTFSIVARKTESTAMDINVIGGLIFFTIGG